MRRGNKTENAVECNSDFFAKNGYNALEKEALQ